MAKFIVRSPVTLKTPTGSQTWKKGEALSLSTSPTTASLVSHGYLLEEQVVTNLLDRYETRVKVLMDKLGYSSAAAQTEAMQLVGSLLKRHESFKSSRKPSPEFLAEVEEFNSASTGGNPISKIGSDDGAGEWAGYRCNIGDGCHHGCLYCYAEGIKVKRFAHVESSEAWLNEVLKDLTTKNCKKYDAPIMFPTTHDISPTYLPAYRCHLYNILNAGNMVVLVSKPHRECIKSICSDFSSFRDTMIFRFTIGSLDDVVLRHWDQFAPDLAERFDCLKIAFENGFKTSISTEPMLCDRFEAEKLYYTLEPYVTEDIWFGKMNGKGGLRKSPDPEVAAQAVKVLDNQTDDEILALVEQLKGLPKVAWKDSIKKVIEKH